MAVSWSFAEKCFRYDCLLGCAGTDYESRREAENAERDHDCMHARFPEGA